MYYIMQFVFLCMDLVYLLIKICPVRHKVVFISRQSDRPSADILLVEKQLHEDDPTIETVKLCRTLGGGIGNKIKYVFHMLVQMYHLATSECVVLDSYCIVVSCLHHRKSLKVIQMWHGLGCFKKFGYSILDKGEGSSLKLARMMHMHEKYDMVFTSSEYCKKAFMEGFNVSEDKMVIAPLPKVDQLRDQKYMAKLAAKIREKYPQLKEKINILYAPTFRKDESEQKIMIQKLIDYVDYDKYNLILCLHPISKLSFDDPRIIVDNQYFTFEMAAVADLVITDYSATTYEMAIMDKKLFYFTFDKEKYDDERGFYTPLSAFPGPKCDDLESLFSEIEKKDYDMTTVRKFVDLNIDPSIRNCCRHISEIIRK